MGFFGKKPSSEPSAPKEDPNDPKVIARKWKRELKSEQRGIDRDVKKIEREIKKVELEVKKAAKGGDITSAKLLAKEIVRSRKQITKMLISKQHLESLELQIQEQIANLRITGALQSTAEIMRTVNNLVKVPEMQQVMMQMTMEMEKQGMLSEMQDEMFEDVFDDSDIEEEADEEVNAALQEIVAGVSGVNIRTTGVTAQQEEEEDFDVSDILQKAEALGL
eukprot:TRINITY_DN3149_c6_g11_i1.p1 TRINITY_DN3149_c6_g11~~TRINITY_DN3149_c6_g11_i1.p1  ORF type:complete len:221 (+),score=91.11 TRINITY_DN3149_c6_g11_i1:489-1151(+)